jgi:hypothetical membrane protein
VWEGPRVWRERLDALGVEVARGKRRDGRMRVTWLLACGVVAGPLYAALVVGQALTRDGFDISRHPASMLSNGAGGWLQIVNFVLSGLLFVAFAAGLRRLPATGTWGPRLIAVFGAGMVVAGVFTADPADGFPPGTPSGAPTTMSWHGGVHFLVASIAFLALITACFVLARRFGAGGWAVFSRVAGAFLLASWVSVFALQGARPANAAFAAAIAVALAWTSLLAAQRLAELKVAA